jgi:hypothetical protein
MNTLKKIHSTVIPLLLFTLFLCVNNPVSPPTQTTSGLGYSVPAGRAWAEGQEIRFVHTEISDPDLAILLTNMMKSPVLVVSSLAQIPDSLLAEVYVFSNGLKGAGPLKFQADVFDKPAGKPGYTPLRRLNVVSWTDTTKATLLKSVSDLVTAQTSGLITIEKKSIVINMPFIVWAEGQR